MSLVEYACNNQIATLSLNRPDRLNAFSDDLVRHLADALRHFDLDPEAQARSFAATAAPFRAAPMCISGNCAGAKNSWSMAGRRAGV